MKSSLAPPCVNCRVDIFPIKYKHTVSLAFDALSIFVVFSNCPLCGDTDYWEIKVAPQRWHHCVGVTHGGSAGASSAPSSASQQAKVEQSGETTNSIQFCFEIAERIDCLSQYFVFSYSANRGRHRNGSKQKQFGIRRRHHQQQWKVSVLLANVASHRGH